MAHPSVIPTHRSALPPQKGVHHRIHSIWHKAPLWVHFVIVAIGALVAIAFVLISANWPYRHRKINPMLEDILTSDVQFTRYQRVYFPRPGFIATGITIRRKTAPPGVPPLGHIDSMMLVGTWTDLIMLRHRVELIDITGFHAIVPAVGSQENRLSFPEGSAKEFAGPDTMIERLVMHESLLEIRRKAHPPLLFPIRQLEIRNFHHGDAMTWAVDMQNAIPRGRIQAHGSMGPIKGSAFVDTPLSGNFTFTNVNLHDVGDISGTVDSRGIFKGTIQSMDVETNATTRNFAVTTGKPTLVDGAMQATLDGSNGNMVVRSIDLKIRETGIHAVGTIRGDPDGTNLDIKVDSGRAEDLMRPFIHDDVPITGTVSLQCHAYLGPPGDGFTERLRVKGQFVVPTEKITNAKAEKSLSAFSERAQGKEKECWPRRHCIVTFVGRRCRFISGGAGQD